MILVSEICRTNTNGLIPIFLCVFLDMHINEILKCPDDFEVSDGYDFLDFDIASLHHDSRTVCAGGLFFALHGTKTNGNKFIQQAIKNGAACIITERALVKCIVPQVVVPNVRKTMSLIAKTFYGNAVDDLKIIAVVGTNGKTTITHMLKHIIESGGEQCGVIGTLGIWYGNKKVTGSMTTPDPIELHKVFAEMRDAGVKTVIMEASAHAISLHKLEGIVFEAAVFTNITRDHLDFFKTFEVYCQTKIDFFLNSETVKTAVINTDDEFGQTIINKRIGKSIGYSLKNINVELFTRKSVFRVEEHTITLNMPARFNVSNALGCIAVSRNIGISYSQIKKALINLPQISGRFNTYSVKDGRTVVIIDYAHTPDGLDKLIQSVREIAPNGRIITVFGCGGNRDKAKRIIMGEISGRLSNYTIITSDNPRYEKPITIMYQIEKGIKRATPRHERELKYTLIVDRTEAINFALYKAKPEDIVIIAGKGGETHMEIKGQKIEYNDENVIKKYDTTQTRAEV